jgi:hypothetical protein
MYGYIPLSLILAGADPYGPTGPFPGGKPSLLDRFRQLGLLRARRPALQASPAQPRCAAPARPAM